MAEFSPQLGDFNSDGRLDLVSGSNCCDPGGIHLFLRRADGSFAERARVCVAKPIFKFATGVTRPHLVDWDGDGHTDLVVGYRGSWTLQVGLGPLADKKVFALKPTDLPPIRGAKPIHFSFADWDGDGRVDLLVGVDKWVEGAERYSIYWFRNMSDSGPPKFAEASHLLDIPESWHLHALTTVDWGGDGWPSLVVSVSKGSKLGEGGRGWWPVASELWLYRRKAEPGGR
jgi:hypothetical protein